MITNKRYFFETILKPLIGMNGSFYISSINEKISYIKN